VIICSLAMDDGNKIKLIVLAKLLGIDEEQLLTLTVLNNIFSTLIFIISVVIYRFLFQNYILW